MPPELPLLTIAIPTYNRSNYLCELLELLAPQLRSREKSVELIISDNASSDGTHNILQRFKSKGLVFKFYQNQENCGADANVLQCFEKASGKYVWICGDDDLILPDALGKILTYLAAEDYDLIYLNSFSFSSADTVKLVAENGNNSTICHTSKSFARKVNISLTFISGIIFNKDRLSSVPLNYFSQSVGTNLNHLRWVFLLLSNQKQSLIIHDRLIAARADNTGGYALFRVFGNNLLDIICRTELPDELARPIVNRTLQRFFPQYILRAKSDEKQFIKEDPDVILRPLFRKNYRYWIFDFPLMALPGRFGRLWMFVIRIINKLDRIIEDYLMR